MIPLSFFQKLITLPVCAKQFRKCGGYDEFTISLYLSLAPFADANLKKPSPECLDLNIRPIPYNHTAYKRISHSFFLKQHIFSRWF